MTQNDIENEVQAMNALCRSKHESLIEIYQHGLLQPPHVYYVLDWNKVKEGGQATFLICAIMQQLLSGIKFIHDNKQVHRDLKPQNGKY